MILSRVLTIFYLLKCDGGSINCQRVRLDTRPLLFATMQNRKYVDHILIYIITLLKDVIMNPRKSIEFCDIGPKFGDCAKLIVQM